MARFLMHPILAHAASCRGAELLELLREMETRARTWREASTHPGTKVRSSSIYR